MINKLKALAIAAVVAIAPVAASAVTVNHVIFQDGVTDFGNINGDIAAGSSISDTNNASVTVVDNTADGETTSFLGFTTSPLNITSSLSISLDQVDVQYAGMLINIFDDAAKTTLLGSGVVPLSAPFSVVVSGALGVSPIFVELDWSALAVTGGTNSFNYDISAVPVPAAGFLLIGALGALGVARRRKS